MLRLLVLSCVTGLLTIQQACRKTSSVDSTLEDPPPQNRNPERYAELLSSAAYWEVTSVCDENGAKILDHEKLGKTYLFRGDGSGYDRDNNRFEWKFSDDGKIVSIAGCGYSGNYRVAGLTQDTFVLKKDKPGGGDVRIVYTANPEKHFGGDGRHHDAGPCKKVASDLEDQVAGLQAKIASKTEEVEMAKRMSGPGSSCEECKVKAGELEHLRGQLRLLEEAKGRADETKEKGLLETLVAFLCDKLWKKTGDDEHYYTFDSSGRMWKVNEKNEYTAVLSNDENKMPWRVCSVDTERSTITLTNAELGVRREDLVRNVDRWIDAEASSVILCCTEKGGGKDVSSFSISGISDSEGIKGSYTQGRTLVGPKGETRISDSTAGKLLEELMREEGREQKLQGRAKERKKKNAEKAVTLQKQQQS